MIKPLIVSSVAEAFERDAERFDEVCSRVTFLETENLILREHVEKLEQYSRRDQVKVYGVKHVANEDTDDLICKIGKEAGSEFSKNDISVSHRVPARNGKLPAIVCQFTTRRVREDFAEKTRLNLRTSDVKLQPSETELKSVFVTDNLTPERAKLLRNLKADDRCKKVFSAGGKIKVVTNVRGHERLITIDSLADIVKLDWSEEDIRALGIFTPSGPPVEMHD